LKIPVTMRCTTPTVEGESVSERRFIRPTKSLSHVEGR
jgi:hypothetical protein